MASDHGNKAPAATTSSSSRPPSDQHQVVVVKCPRCDSPNTKFCYYNNYSLTQPRHFCKTCRRYWTKGGALRNVPIGGGCRKSKKLKSSSSSSSTSTSTLANSTTSSSSTTSELGGFKFFHHAGGLNSPPSMDFNLKDLSLMPSPPPPATGMINYNLQSQFSFDSGASLSAAPPLGFSLEPSSLTASGAYPMMMMIPGGGRGGNGNGTAGLINGSMNVNTSLASSIESLSCMNQDLHWKLQQQRLSLLFGDNTTAPKEDGGGGMPRQHADDDGGQQQQQQPEKPQPILFRDLGEIRTDSKQHEVVGGGGGKGDGEAATEWFFGNSYGQVVGSGCGAGAGSASAAPAAAVAGTPSNSSSNSNWNGSNGGVQAWGDLNPYTTSLP